VLVTAMEEAQVKRLICVTGFGAGDSRGHGGFFYCAAFHLLLGRVYDDKDAQGTYRPQEQAPSCVDWITKKWRRWQSQRGASDHFRRH
jgi:hypothetical protein